MIRFDNIMGKSFVPYDKTGKVLDVLENLPYDEAVQSVSEKITEEVKSFDKTKLNTLKEDIFDKNKND